MILVLKDRLLMKKKTRILGIDPGTVITGYGIIDTYSKTQDLIDYGAIRPPAKKSLHERYVIIHKAIDSLLVKYQPDVVSVETQFVKKNPQIALKLGMARGVIILACSLKNIPVFEYAPRKAKQAICGSGSATKEQVQKMIKMLLALKEIPKPEDAADALALALCHANQLKLPICTNM